MAFDSLSHDLLALLSTSPRDGRRPAKGNPIAILEAIQGLEEQQQRGSLAQLAGTWALLWTTGTRQSQQWQRGLWMQANPSQPLGSIYQCIDATNAQLEIIAEFGLARMRVSGSFLYTPQHRLAFTFTAMGLQLGTLPNLSIPLGQWAKGWLQTTYLDETLHIERGDRGGVSVYRRVVSTK
jgi:hypothetical protein